MPLLTWTVALLSAFEQSSRADLACAPAALARLARAAPRHGGRGLTVTQTMFGTAFTVVPGPLLLSGARMSPIPTR